MLLYGDLIITYHAIIHFLNFFLPQQLTLALKRVITKRKELRETRHEMKRIIKKLNRLIRESDAFLRAIGC